MFGVPGGGPNLDVVGAAATSLADLDPIYKRLLDEPVTAIVAVTGSDAAEPDPSVVRLRGRHRSAEPGHPPQEGGLAAQGAERPPSC